MKYKSIFEWNKVEWVVLKWSGGFKTKGHSAKSVKQRTIKDPKARCRVVEVFFLIHFDYYKLLMFY